MKERERERERESERVSVRKQFQKCGKMQTEAGIGIISGGGQNL